MPKPNQIGKLTTVEGMDPTFTQHYSQLIDMVNTLAGYNGTIQLSDHIDMGGKSIKNVVPTSDPGDVVTQALAAKKYSPSAIRPYLESNGSVPLQTQRRLNDPNQREQQSSWLNDLMGTPPSANTLFPILTNVGGGVQVDLPASTFTFADGSIVSLLAYTHLLSLPASYTISSISATGNVVTVVLTTPSTLTAGSAVTIEGVTPSSFNGTFVLTSVTGGGTTFTYQLSIGTVTGSGGTALLNGVYYFTVTKRSNLIFVKGPFAADTAQNRLQANFDSFQIVAVVVVTASGGQVESSGGGGSPLTGPVAAGAFL
jgi:hypothetical protein